MATGEIKTRFSASLATTTAALALIVAAGPAAQEADAASPCVRWGETNPDELSHPQARKAVFCLVNKERTKRGLSKLDRDGHLQKAAQKHSEWMRSHKCFAHECPGEQTVEQRLGGVGYLISSLVRWAYGENIAYGSGSAGTPKQIVKAWMNSSGHRANILNPSFRDLGVGFAEGTPSDPNEVGGIYTTDFGLAVH